LEYMNVNDLPTNCCKCLLLWIIKC
jgi:hypothetical protein